MSKINHGRSENKPIFFTRPWKGQCEVSVGDRCVSKSHFAKKTQKGPRSWKSKTDENLISQSE